MRETNLTTHDMRSRQMRIRSLLVSLLQDIRYSFRLLVKKPSFAITALLSLAVAVGFNTAIFSVVNVVLFEPLPYEHSQNLGIIWTTFPSANVYRAPAAGPELDELQKRSRLLEGIAGVWTSNLAFVGEGEPEQVKLAQVTANFFSVLGAHPGLGRDFLPEEEGRNSGVVILSDGLWRRRYGADPSIVGKAIRTGRGPLTVIGVMPRDFELLFPPDAAIPPDVQAWMPFNSPLGTRSRDLGFLRIIARLRSGVTFQRAQSELDGIAHDLRAQFPEFGSQQMGIQLIQLHADLVKDVRAPLVALFIGVVLVLLIACANVANLLMTLATERSREMTMRAALGATRVRMVRQLLTESVLLALLGGSAGLGLAALLIKILPLLWPDAVPRLAAIGFNIPTLLFTVGICFLTGIIFGLVPAFGASKVNLVNSLKDAGKNFVSGRGSVRRLLVLIEVTFAFVLLTGAGLMLRTFVQLIRVDPGFRPDRVLAFTVSLPGNRYRGDVKVTTFFDQLEKQLAQIPGVQSAAATSHVPLDEFSNWWSYYYPEGAAADQQQTQMADHRCVSPGLFRTLQVPLLAGRYFNESDDMSHPRVLIVDDLLAQKTWPGQSALGKKLNVETVNNGDFKPAWTEVVGVVKHINYQSLVQEGRPQVYLPVLQSPRGSLPMSFVVRSTGPVETLIGPVKQAVARLDKDLPVAKIRSLDEMVATAQARVRFTTLLSGMLALIATFLACVGIFGVTSYSVTQATSEIGIRMALGAHRRDILRLVLRQSMLFILLGIVLGTICSAALAPGISGLLFRVKPLDIATFSTVIIVLIAVGLLACLLPAARASRIDPMAALRYE